MFRTRTPPAAPTETPAPIFADEGAATLLRRVALFILIIGVPAATGSLLSLARPFGLRWLAVGELLVVGLAVLAALRRQRVRLAVHVLLCGLLLLVSLQTVIVAGIRTPAIMAYPLLLMLSGWLLGRRTAYVILTMTLLWLTGVALLTDSFWPAPGPGEASSLWTVVMLTCGVATILAVHIAQSNRSRYEAQAQVSTELARRLDQLQQARDNLATLFHLNPIPVSVTRIEDGTYLDANPAWARISGWPRGEMLGKSSSALGIWIESGHRQAFVDAVSRDGRVVNYLAPFRMRGGEVRYFLLSSEMVEYDGHTSIFSAFVDITERRAAEESLEKLNAELEQRVAERTKSLRETLATLRRAQDELVQSDKLASLGSLVAGIAHELNTPIGNAVLIATTLMDDMQALRSAYESANLRRSSLESFITDGARAVSLLDQSLSQARELVSSFKQVAIDQSSERRRSFSLNALVHDICETLRPSMRRGAWQLETVLDADSELDSYPGPLGQVLTNLVQNAFFHGLQEDEPGIVKIQTRLLGDGQIALSVSDDGRGIPPENLGLIFDPFFTTRLGQGGSGLGLAIVYRLVTTLLGGRIRVDSVPGEGSRFTVTVPCQAPSQG